MAGKNRQFEDAEQAALFDWARLEFHMNLPKDFPNVGDWLFSVPNGGNRNAREVVRLKRQGLRPGVWDCFLPVVIHGQVDDITPGLWIEMKKQRQHFKSKWEADHSLSENQQIWGIQMEAMGYKTVVCYGFDDARKAILEYLDGR